jgi:1-acyl-sn-glycerol-3-phosphate acyltransferase
MIPRKKKPTPKRATKPISKRAPKRASIAPKAEKVESPKAPAAKRKATASKDTLEMPAAVPMVDPSSIEVGNPPSSDELPDSEESSPALEEIRALEERLDRMIDDARHSHTQLPEDRPSTRAPVSSRSLGSATGEGLEPTVFDTARELLSTDYYLRQWGRIGMRNRSEEVDDFGWDPVYEEKVRPLFDFLYERWFRVSVDGIANVPATGRCLLVANHSGTVPFDGVMLKTAIKREHPAHRDVRWLAEDFIFHFPFLGSITNRIGAVRACQENAERLLAQDSLIAVFPEGVKGIGKLYRDRYKLQRFGRGGFVKLCLRTQTPIVPVAVVGGEETNPLLARLETFSKALGIPYVPVTATFPLLGPLGLLPAPTKWRIVFGEPIALEEGPEAADDEILVGRIAERVRVTIQGMLDRAVRDRRSVWSG